MKNLIRLLTRADRPATVSDLLAAAEYMDSGEGCSTVAFYLNRHWKTASAMMDAGRLLPRVR